MTRDFRQPKLFECTSISPFYKFGCFQQPLDIQHRSHP